MNWQPIENAPKDESQVVWYQGNWYEATHFDGDAWITVCDHIIAPTQYLPITPPGEQQPESSIRRGWREFECNHGDDNPATYRWAEPTRDRFSPSKGDCPVCQECVPPIRNWVDAELSVDAFGNLTAEKTQHPESVNQRLLDALLSAKRFITSLRVPQNIPDAALQIMQGEAVIGSIDAAIDAAKQATKV